MRKTLHNSKSGFTLVESLIAVMLFTILFGASILIYLSGSESWQVNSTRLELQQEMRKAIARVTQDIREAGTSSVLDVPADDTWRNMITFRKPSGVSGGNIVWDTNTTSYYIGGPGSDRLIEQTGISTTSIAANDITNIQFRRLNSEPRIVEISITASKTTLRGRTLTMTSAFDIQLRNG